MDLVTVCEVSKFYRNTQKDFSENLHYRKTYKQKMSELLNPTISILLLKIYLEFLRNPMFGGVFKQDEPWETKEGTGMALEKKFLS